MNWIYKNEPIISGLGMGFFVLNFISPSIIQVATLTLFFLSRYLYSKHWLQTLDKICDEIIERREAEILGK